MAKTNLRVVERKVLGALLQLADNDLNVTCTQKELAQRMGYKQTGGAINFALEGLEIKNYLSRLGKNQYTVLI